MLTPLLKAVALTGLMKYWRPQQPAVAAFSVNRR
jgi:hypothetical protein